MKDGWISYNTARQDIVYSPHSCAEVESPVTLESKDVLAFEHIQLRRLLTQMYPYHAQEGVYDVLFLVLAEDADVVVVSDDDGLL
jgi:hypothetical protein